MFLCSIDSINEHLLERFDKVASEVADTKSTIQHVDTHNKMLDKIDPQSSSVPDLQQSDFMAWKRKISGVKHLNVKNPQLENSRQEMLSA